MDFAQFKYTGQELQLSALPTCVDGEMSDAELKKRREKLWNEIHDLQEKLYAESQQSMLIVLQAMDAAGKDSTIEKLTRSMNAQGWKVSSFKAPTRREQAHDFLWRVHQVVPGNGEITIFNRSHYEDVLIVRVHDWKDETTIKRRYQHINNFESLLADNRTRVVKFMLNVSPEFQLTRFQKRLENPGKHWKFNPGDLDERQHWGKYMESFELAITNCACEEAPWYVVPAENRRFRDVMIATVVRDTLLSMAPDFPEPEFDLNQYTPESIG